MLRLGREPVVLRAKHRGSGGADRDRTDDLVVANDALSQLSYGPMGVIFGPVNLRSQAGQAGIFALLRTNCSMALAGIAPA